MNKQELVEKVAEKTGEYKKKVGDILDSILEVIVETSKKEEVKLTGYFKTEIKTTKERMGRNPKTGDEVLIPSRKVIKIRVGNKFDIAGDAND